MCERGHRKPLQEGPSRSRSAWSQFWGLGSGSVSLGVYVSVCAQICACVMSLPNAPPRLLTEFYFCLVPARLAAEQHSSGSYSSWALQMSRNGEKCAVELIRWLKPWCWGLSVEQWNSNVFERNDQLAGKIWCSSASLWFTDDVCSWFVTWPSCLKRLTERTNVYHIDMLSFRLS